MRVLIFAFVLSSCAGRDPSPSPDASVPCAMQLEWGRNVSGTFTPYRDGESAEITLGFQGFRFIDAIARIRGTRATAATFTFQATLPGREPSVQHVGPFDGRQGADDALYVSALQLFFNDVPMPELIGQGVEVIVTARAGGCSARTGARVSLVRGGCMDTDGGIAPCDAGP